MGRATSTVNKNEAAVKALEILGKTNIAVKGMLARINAVPGDAALSDLFTQIAKDVEQADERARSSRLSVGIVGGRGSGKSTLANAMMGEDLLPDGAILFTTAIPTRITYEPENHLIIESDLEEYRCNEMPISLAEMKKILHETVKHTNNKDNIKRITNVCIGIPNKSLDTQELVDVPGFTKGNPLHQALAERFAKHYCDVCLVLINDCGAVEIGAYEGLEALARTFEERLTSCVFLINKCDVAGRDEIQETKEVFCGYLSQSPTIFELSAKNTLRRVGKQFEIVKYLNHLNYINTRRSIVLAIAVLGRLISSFKSLVDLCKLSSQDLDAIGEEVRILKFEFKQQLAEAKESVLLRIDVPQDINFDFQSLDLTVRKWDKGPKEFSEHLVEKIQKQTTELVDRFVQERQVAMYQSFNTFFESEMSDLSRKLHARLERFKRRFGIQISIDVPSVGEGFAKHDFNPAQIQKLKPLPTRVWLERQLGGILQGALTNNLRMYQTDITIKMTFGLAEIKVPLAIPIGIMGTAEERRIEEARIVQQSQERMNAHIQESLDAMAKWQAVTYRHAIETFEGNWAHQLNECDKRIQAAKSLTSDEWIDEIEQFVTRLRVLQSEANDLLAAV